ncbi:MAG: signal peptide peptidase SppA [Rhodobacteraceae bacterium]|nr:signal peptide peptidase SppA [Paracoccaceae bacterium]
MTGSTGDRDEPPLGARRAPGPWDRASGGANEAMLALFSAAQEAANTAAEEKRRLRRRLFWWRLGALALAVVLIVSVIASRDGGQREHIARVDVLGVILDDRARDDLLLNIADNDAAKALIVRIDSPGGTTVGGEAIFESLRKVSEKKPVVAVLGEVAASGGYIAALAADRIIARGNTITASIGVIFTAPNFSGALEKLGIEVVEVKSGAQKAEPSPYKPVDPAVLEADRALIDDSFDWFLGLVRDRRDLTDIQLAEVRDGRILTGRLALEEGLIDQLGGEADAIAWLRSERGVPDDLPVVDHAPLDPERGFLGQLVDDAFGSLALGGATTYLEPLTRPGPRLISQVR